LLSPLPMGGRGRGEGINNSFSGKTRILYPSVRFGYIFNQEFKKVTALLFLFNYL